MKSDSGPICQFRYRPVIGCVLMNYYNNKQPNSTQNTKIKPHAKSARQCDC